MTISVKNTHTSDYLHSCFCAGLYVKILTKLFFSFFFLLCWCFYRMVLWFLNSSLMGFAISGLSLTLIGRLWEQISAAGVILGLGNETNCWVIDLLSVSFLWK